jgi:hypothetical protein
MMNPSSENEMSMTALPMKSPLPRAVGSRSVTLERFRIGRVRSIEGNGSLLAQMRPVLEVEPVRHRLLRLLDRSVWRG